MSIGFPNFAQKNFHGFAEIGTAEFKLVLATTCIGMTKSALFDFRDSVLHFSLWWMRW